jgi:hypothetical protein
LRKVFLKIIIVIIGLISIIGFCICNISLNRTIYCNEVHMKSEEQNYRSRSNTFDLDDMGKTLDKLEDKIDNPNKYKQTDFGLSYKVYIPKFRILFSANPLDIRFESKDYTVYLNGSIVSNIKSGIDYYIKNRFFHRIKY